MVDNESLIHLDSVLKVYEACDRDPWKFFSQPYTLLYHGQVINLRYRLLRVFNYKTLICPSKLYNVDNLK